MLLDSRTGRVALFNASIHPYSQALGIRHKPQKNQWQFGSVCERLAQWIYSKILNADYNGIPGLIRS